jgi:SAM-dependent methyltransferase
MMAQSGDAMVPMSGQQPDVARASPGSTGWGYEEIAAAVAAHYDPQMVAVPGQTFNVLEAGGGSDSWLKLPDGARITTIDISAEQLAMNTYASEKLLGDLQTFDYGARRFDLIVCWDVLEHLEQPDAAVRRFAAVLAPGGRLIIKGPLTKTVKGLVTRFTPHGLHVMFYKYVLGSVFAGQPGHPPFKAYLAHGSAPDDIARLLAAHDINVDATQSFESAHVTAIAAKSRVALVLYRAAERVLGLVTLGRYKAGVTDFFLIGRKAD